MESIQWHLPVVALLDMPDTAAFTKASGWRRFKYCKDTPNHSYIPPQKPL